MKNQNVINLDDDTKSRLHIVTATEYDFIFRSTAKELSFYNYKDGDIEISITDAEINSFILNKEQINALLTWIASIVS